MESFIRFFGVFGGWHVWPWGDSCVTLFGRSGGVVFYVAEESASVVVSERPGRK